MLSDREHLRSDASRRSDCSGVLSRAFSKMLSSFLKFLNPQVQLITPPVNKVQFFERMGRGRHGFGRNLVEILPTSLPELLYSSGTLETTKNHQKPTFYFL